MKNVVHERLFLMLKENETKVIDPGREKRKKTVRLTSFKIKLNREQIMFSKSLY